MLFPHENNENAIILLHKSPVRVNPHLHLSTVPFWIQTKSIPQERTSHTHPLLKSFFRF